MLYVHIILKRIPRLLS